VVGRQSHHTVIPPRRFDHRGRAIKGAKAHTPPPFWSISFNMSGTRDGLPGPPNLFIPSSELGLIVHEMTEEEREAWHLIQSQYFYDESTNISATSFRKYDILPRPHSACKAAANETPETSRSKTRRNDAPGRRIVHVLLRPTPKMAITSPTVMQ